MRLALLAVCLAGCVQQSDPHDDYWDGSGGWGSGWGGGGGTTSYGCQSDSACGGELVCTRTGECMDAAYVHAVRTEWTVDGAAASDASCSAAPKLSISFMTDYPGEEFGYTPVPCNAGVFTVDKLPMRYTRVQLSRAGVYTGGATGTFDADGLAVLDLPY